MVNDSGHGWCNKGMEMTDAKGQMVTNCAFGGDDPRTLYITGGGTLYSIRTATPGRVVWPIGK